MDEGISPSNTDGVWAKKCCCGVSGARFRHKDNTVEGNPRLLAFFDDPLESFLDFLLNHGPRTTTTIVLTHNGGKYDIHLMLEKIYSLGLVPEMTMTGKCWGGDEIFLP